MIAPLAIVPDISTLPLRKNLPLASKYPDVVVVVPLYLAKINLPFAVPFCVVNVKSLPE